MLDISPQTEVAKGFHLLCSTSENLESNLASISLNQVGSFRIDECELALQIENFANELLKGDCKQTISYAGFIYKAKRLNITSGLSKKLVFFLMYHNTEKLYGISTC